MLTRHIVPTAGNAHIVNHSILNDFKLGSTHLGVVTQNNSLWDLLSVQDHLKLFARLRGVPEDLVYKVVESTIDQLELTPHRYKLAGRLSGGMKRKVQLLLFENFLIYFFNFSKLFFNFFSIFSFVLQLH